MCIRDSQYGDLYVRTLKRDESGKLVTETPEGADYQIPVNGGEQNSDQKYMGNMNSKWNMGWNNTFRYKDLTLSMLIDFRIGGKVVSMTEATLDGYGAVSYTHLLKQEAQQVIKALMRVDELCPYVKGLLKWENYCKDVALVRSLSNPTSLQ